MWLRFSFLVLLVTAFCSSVTGTPRIKLSDGDRAAIIGSVARDLFKPGRNYEGKHFILANGIRPDWIPRIRGYDVRLLSQDEIDSVREPIYYYTLLLRPQKHSVRVTVYLYDSQTKTFPHVLRRTPHNKSGMKDEVKRKFLPPRDQVMIDFVGHL